MIIPRFSIKRLLIVTAGFAVFSWAASWALGGNGWAFVLVIGILSIFVALVLHLLAFVAFSIVGHLIPDRGQPAVARSPGMGDAAVRPASERPQSIGNNQEAH